MLTLAQLREKRGTMVDELGTIAGAEKFDRKAYDALNGSVTEIDGQIVALEETQKRQAALARPVHGQGADQTGDDDDLIGDDEIPAHLRSQRWSPNGSEEGPRASLSRGAAPLKFSSYLRKARHARGFQLDKTKHFRSLGEQLQAVFMHATTRGSTSDSRLVRSNSVEDRFNRAGPTGAGEVDPTGGGFLVQTDFANAIFMLAHDMGELLGRVNKLTIGSQFNGIKIPGVDETSRATGSRWGGVQSYWVGEGTSVTNTKPKFRLIEFDLKKLMSAMYTTDELIQDQNALSAIAGQAFSEEIMFMTEDAIYEGTGAGQPLGFLNAPAAVQVAKEVGQAAGTVLKDNIDKMYARMWVRSLPNAAWFINQDVLPQLVSMNQAIGTGGSVVYLPAGGLSAAPFATLYNRPVIWTEYSAALGTPGDITFADLGQYTLVDKNGVQMASSMHVAFLTDEMVFRITYRVDGKPMWSTALTPFKGSLTKSPFITLAQR